MSKFCNNCGKKQQEGALFCSFCGTKAKGVPTSTRQMSYDSAQMNKAERSTGSKILFGTYLTNGLSVCAIGLIAFLAGLNNYGYELRNWGISWRPSQLVSFGVFCLLIGVSLICVHFSKKKS